MSWKEIDGKRYWVGRHPDPSLDDRSLAWVADDGSYVPFSDEDWEKYGASR